MSDLRALRIGASVAFVFYILFGLSVFVRSVDQAANELLNSNELIDSASFAGYLVALAATFFVSRLLGIKNINQAVNLFCVALVLLAPAMYVNNYLHGSEIEIELYVLLPFIPAFILRSMIVRKNIIFATLLFVLIFIISVYKGVNTGDILNIAFVAFFSVYILFIYVAFAGLGYMLGSVSVIAINKLYRRAVLI